MRAKLSYTITRTLYQVKWLHLQVCMTNGSWVIAKKRISYLSTNQKRGRRYLIGIPSWWGDENNGFESSSSGSPIAEASISTTSCKLGRRGNPASLWEWTWSSDLSSVPVENMFLLLFRINWRTYHEVVLLHNPEQQSGSGISTSDTVVHSLGLKQF